jgi:hypothetical protein
MCWYECGIAAVSNWCDVWGAALPLFDVRPCRCKCGCGIADVSAGATMPFVYVNEIHTCICIDVYIYIYMYMCFEGLVYPTRGQGRYL